MPTRLPRRGDTAWHGMCLDLAVADFISAPKPLKRAHLTVSDRDILNGVLCDCEACFRDGQHEPECVVHDEPRGDCSCGRDDQAKSAG